MVSVAMVTVGNISERVCFGAAGFEGRVREPPLVLGTRGDAPRAGTGEDPKWVRKVTRDAAASGPWVAKMVCLQTGRRAPNLQELARKFPAVFFSGRIDTGWLKSVFFFLELSLINCGEGMFVKSGR